MVQQPVGAIVLSVLIIGVSWLWGKWVDERYLGG